MARPSKTQQFAIYHDTAHIPPTPPPDPSEPSFDDTSRPSNYFDKDDGSSQDVQAKVEDTIEKSNILPTDTEVDDDRRQSAVSSLPDSSTETDGDYSLPMHKPYTPPMIRPSFRKPDSVRSMYDRSPNRSVHHVRSRNGTPRSVRANAKGSPLARTRYEEETGIVEDKKQYPLILLHVTLLPVQLRWSAESMREILPQSTLDNLELLQSKISETIAQRGILILHPKEEYELLEERLLEALELKKERVTKCGHFRARDSIDSVFSTGGSARSSDSGVGSSVPDSDNEMCTTCSSPVKMAVSGAGTGKHKWSVKVFAANGLMRASAWAAAWSEMESVDVEILPWISEGLRKRIDATMAEESAETRRQEEEAHVRSAVQRQARIAYDSQEQPPGEWKQHDVITPVNPFIDVPPVASPLKAPPSEFLSALPKETASPLPDLPPVYSRKDIPLSILLKNYIFLLAQDKKNVAIFGLAVFTLWMSLRSAGAPTRHLSVISHIDEANAVPFTTNTPVDLLHDSAADIEMPAEVNPAAMGAIEVEERGVNYGMGTMDESSILTAAIHGDVSVPQESSIPAGRDPMLEAGMLEKGQQILPDPTEDFPGQRVLQLQHLAAGSEVCRNPAQLRMLFGQEFTDRTRS